MFGSGDVRQPVVQQTVQQNPAWTVSTVGNAELKTAGHEDGRKNSIQSLIDDLKSRSIVYKSYETWANKSQNIQNLAALERLIQRVDWYCNEIKGINGWRAPDAQQMRMAMIDTFRSEFRFAPPFVAQLLRAFDGDVLQNMQCIRLVEASQRPIGANENTDGTVDGNFLHWRLRSLSKEILGTYVAEHIFAEKLFGEACQSNSATLAEMLGLSHLSISWAPPEKPMFFSPCTSCSGYTLLEETQETLQPLPFRSVWEIPQLVAACETINVAALRQKLGTSFLSGGWQAMDLNNKLVQRSPLKQLPLEVSVLYGYFPHHVHLDQVPDFVVSSIPAPMTPVRSQSSVDSMQPMQMPSPQASAPGPPGVQVGASKQSVSFAPSMGSFGPDSLTNPQRMWRQPVGDEVPESSCTLTHSLCLREVTIFPGRIMVQMDYRATASDPRMADVADTFPILSFCLGDATEANSEDMTATTSQTEDGNNNFVFDVVWSLSPVGLIRRGMPDLPIDFRTQSSISLWCYIHSLDGTPCREVCFSVPFPELCRTDEWLQAQSALPTRFPQLNLNQLLQYLNEVPKSLFFRDLPSFAMSLSQLRTVLLADIDAGTMMQGRILAAMASGIFAVATYGFNFLIAQHGWRMETLATNVTQGFHI